MLTDQTKHLHANFFTDSVMERSVDKKTRILHVCRSVDFEAIVHGAIHKVAEISRQNLKIEDKTAMFKFAQRYYSSDLDETKCRKVITLLNKIIQQAQYGGVVFAEAYHLRAKCNLKLMKFSPALTDIELAIQFGGLNAERIWIKAISLYSEACYKVLKDFLRSIDLTKFEFAEFQQEINNLGFQHLSINHMVSFVNDPNFANRSTRALERYSKDEIAQYFSVIPLKNNFQLDKRCRIENDSQKGRHFLATDLVPKGTQVLVERSYSVVLNKHVQLEYCLHCYRHCPDSYLPCKFCTNAIFCNEECFAKAWSTFHRNECTLLPLFTDAFNSGLHMYRAITRIGVKPAISMYNKFNKYCNDPILEEKAINVGKSTKALIHDKYITKYLEDEELRNTPEEKQSKEQKMSVYKTAFTLLDHNDRFETYYDICYMGTAIDVALMLLLNDYLLTKSKLNAFYWDQFDSQEMIESFRENKDRKLEDYVLFGYSMMDFVRLVEIIQLNIRKLGTNVFSWNSYHSDYTVKKNVATCQCLVGSFINHSCDPNVEWDFQDGWIIYTATRDINPGEEINNSYGPHKGSPFKERQLLLANNYYFYCRCSACWAEVSNYPGALQCPTCTGPVVYLPDATIETNCMKCWQPYLHGKYRMKKLEETQAQFDATIEIFEKSTFTFYEDTFWVERFLSKLYDAIDFQLKHFYPENQVLKKNLRRFSRILSRLNILDKAYYYAQLAYVKPPIANEESIESKLDYLEYKVFWLNLVKKYVTKYSKNVEEDIPRSMLEYYSSSIEREIRRLIRKINQSPEVEEDDTELSNSSSGDLIKLVKQKSPLTQHINILVDLLQHYSSVLSADGVV